MTQSRRQPPQPARQPAAAPPAPAPAPAPPRWQYRRANLPDAALVEGLDALGAGGWELVQASPARAQQRTGGRDVGGELVPVAEWFKTWDCLFRRPLPAATVTPSEAQP